MILGEDGNSLSFTRKKREREETETKSRMPVVQVLLRCLLPWSAFFRTLELLINSVDFSRNYLIRPWDSRSWAVIFTTSLPNYFLMSTYLLLVLFWGALYRLHQRQLQGKGLRGVESLVSDLLSLWVLLTSCELLPWVLLMVLMAALPDQIEQLHQVEQGYAVMIGLVIALFFAVWGWNLTHALRQRWKILQKQHEIRMGVLGMPSTSNAHTVAAGVASKIFVLTVVCTCLFVLRSVLILLCSFVIESQMLLFICLMVWLLACEYLPTLLMIIILWWSVPHRP